ncbi:hypothetical protein ACHAXT_009244 [Thalassiosira profunda]
MSSYAQQKKKGGNEPWRNRERHYCAICNAWMGSDRQSILLHENGKKHKEAVEADLQRRRDEKAKKEKDKRDLDKVFAKVNAAAGVSAGAGFGAAKPWELNGQSVPAPPPPRPVQKPKSAPKPAAKPKPAEKPKVPAKPVFDPNVGHYSLEGTTYLEGKIYAKVLEDGMPIQLWMGSVFASDEEKRDLRNFNHWKMALLAKVVKKRGGDISCHVSYLNSAEAEEETLESNVSPSRIRLVLGSDPSIPGTMEEAHLALMGGEQTIHVDKGADKEQGVDENTGLSGWSTTTIRKVSSHYEQNQEKKRKLQHEKEVAEHKEKREKELQARKMEEAKYANAHDSALGAYDVWSSSTSAVEGKTKAYKGVDITKETKMEVADTAKSLSKGMGNVGFKKKKVKKKATRKTSADDD